MPMQISASLKVDERSVLVRSTDAKPDAADGVDERIGLLTVDLAADAPDVDIDDVGRGVEVQIPDVLQQHRAGDDLALVAHEVLEHLKFARQQLDLLPAARHRPRDQVELEIADAQHRLLDDRAAAPGERFDPRQQFREGERLDEVVVAARAQAAHAIVDLAEGADDQSGREDALVAQPADDREPVDVRKHAIDDRDGMVGGGREPDALAALAGLIDLIAARRREID